MSTRAQATDGSKSSPPKQAKTKTKKPSTPAKRRKRRSAVTARRFFDLVVLVLGEKTSFTANQSVPMREVQDEVLLRSDLTDRERTSHDEKVIRRKIEFAFRNRRAEYVGKTGTALTVAGEASGQWALTEAGVAKAKVLAGESEELPPEPEPEAPADPEVEAAAPEPEEPEAPKKRGPRTLSEASSS